MTPDDGGVSEITTAPAPTPIPKGKPTSVSGPHTITMAVPFRSIVVFHFLMRGGGAWSLDALIDREL